ncbi:MAG: alpha/beta hydrolase [Deltaproteobacteria bacterium]
MTEDKEIRRGVFVETEGMRFEVDMAGDPQSDHLALLLHGFPELNFAWRHQMPVFARQGFKVWAPNQRGYGKTTRPLGVRNYTIDHLMADVTRLIDASGCSQITLVGHDWGGVVAWSYALLPQKHKLERLVIMNIPHPTIMAKKLRTAAQLRKSWYAYFFQIPKLPELLLGARGARAIGEAFTSMAIDKSRFPTEVTNVFRANASQPGALTAMIGWYRAMRYASPAWRAAMAAPQQIKTPTLMLWGEEDTALGKELTYGTEELVEDLVLRYLPNVSHWVQQEAPETVNRMLEAWLAGAPVPEAEASEA